MNAKSFSPNTPAANERTTAGEADNTAMWFDIPDWVIESARKIERYFAEQAITSWSVAGIQSRIYSAPSSAPAVSEGWQVVPKEPTGAMLDAATISHADAEWNYRAMLAASPEYKP